MKYAFGPRDLEWGTELKQLPTSNDVLDAIVDDDAETAGRKLRERFERDGYFYFKQLIPRDAVLAARQAILSYIDERSDSIEPDTELFDGVMKPGTRAPFTMGKKDITHEPVVRRVLEAPEVFDFFRTYFGEPVLTLDYKWLRAVPHDTNTGAHMDNVYMGRGSERLHTVWTPFGDIPLEQGTLAICRGSHRDASFAKLRETYGKADVDRDRVWGWFTNDPLEITEKFGGEWLGTDVEAGDVIIIGMYTMHASTTNATRKWRLSCDTRFQPAADKADDRWVGDTPAGHLANEATDMKPMAVAREEWGV